MADPLIELFAEVLDVPADSLNDDTSATNTGQWDSLAAMHLVAAIEDKFNVTLSTKDILRMSSIGGARQVLGEKGASV